MSIQLVVELSRDLFYTAMLLVLPALGASLIVGVLISIFQAITSIQEQTLSYVPRILVVGLVILFTMSWSMQTAINYTMRIFSQATELTR
jgi:flagellar biosynthetic protein FliQ